ncbi:hypothetical protein D3C74_351580 [compost metagenome]
MASSVTLSRTSTREARACRATFVSASPTTTTSWSATSAGTSDESSLSMMTEGANPSAGVTASAAAVRRSWRLASGGVVAWSAKIVERISRMVSSRSFTASSTRERTISFSMCLVVLMSVIADAKIRWMTTSCRSRAMRSRSSSTATRRPSS